MTEIVCITIAIAILAIYLYNETKPKMNTKVINQLEKLIDETKGKFFSITFVKNDGSIRIINGKDKYRRLMSNSGKESPAKKAGYVSFVNRNKETWACAKDTAVVKFKCGQVEKIAWQNGRLV